MLKSLFLFFLLSNLFVFVIFKVCFLWVQSRYLLFGQLQLLLLSWQTSFLIFQCLYLFFSIFQLVHEFIIFHIQFIRPDLHLPKPLSNLIQFHGCVFMFHGLTVDFMFEFLYLLLKFKDFLVWILVLCWLWFFLLYLVNFGLESWNIFSLLF